MSLPMAAEPPFAVLLQAIRFAWIGVIATAVHVTAALVAGHVLELVPLAANLAGFCLAFVVSFIGHARFTFRVGQPGAVHLRRFLILSVASLVLSSAITATLTALGAGLAQAMFCVGLIVPAFSYLGARLWAFRDAEAP